MAGFLADESAGADIRDCISVTSFTAGTGDPIPVPGYHWNLMGFTMDVLYKQDCVWRLESGYRGYSPDDVDPFGTIDERTVGTYLDALYNLLENDSISLDRATSVYERDIHEAARTTLQLHDGLPAREVFTAGVLAQLATYLQYDSPSLTIEQIGNLEVEGESYRSYGFRSGQAGSTEQVRGSIAFRYDSDIGWGALAIRDHDSE